MPKRKTSSRVRAAIKRRPASDPSSDLLKLVRSGVKRFVLLDAPIAAFQKAVREASQGGKFSVHPLSGKEFRRIVQEAVAQRKQILVRRRLNQKPIKRKGAAS